MLPPKNSGPCTPICPSSAPKLRSTLRVVHTNQPHASLPKFQVTPPFLLPSGGRYLPALHKCCFILIAAVCCVPMLQFSFMHSGYVLHVLCFELLMLHQISIYRWLQPNAKHLHLVALAPSEGEEGPKAVRYAELHCKTHARGPRTRPCTLLLPRTSSQRLPINERLPLNSCRPIFTQVSTP